MALCFRIEWTDGGGDLRSKSCIKVAKENDGSVWLSAGVMSLWMCWKAVLDLEGSVVS